MTLRVAAGQLFATPFALDRNLSVAERLVCRAAQGGAQIVGLPAFFNTGYVYTPRLSAAAQAVSLPERSPGGQRQGAPGPQALTAGMHNGLTLRWLSRLSAEQNILIGGPSLLRERNRIYNALVLVEPAGQVYYYRQQHPCLWEHCYFESGPAPAIIETSLGRIGFLIGWDIAFRSAWEAYRGKVDLVLVASALPRLHRAVLNFPEAHKAYVAELLPELIRHRDAIDSWLVDRLGWGAAYVGAPLIHAGMAGRFVTEIPFPRLSFGLAALRRSKYLPWVGQASQTTLRATFFGGSAIVEPGGRVAGQVVGDEGVALAEVGSGVPASPIIPEPEKDDGMLPKLPAQLRLLEFLMRGLGVYYRRAIRNS